MPTRLGCLSLSSEFSCSGHVNYKMDSRACYGDALYSFKDARNPHEVTWKIKIYSKTTRQISSSGRNNFTLLTKEDMEFLLDYCRSTYDIDFGYAIEDPKSQETGENYYLLILNINRRKTEQKFVLTWIRHFYEYPYNMFMLDAIKLMNEEKSVEKEHLLNLLQLIGTTYSLNDYDNYHFREYRSDQCLCLPYKKFITVDRVKKSNAENDSITRAWNRSVLVKEHKDFVHFKTSSSKEIEESMTYEYWTDPQNWEERRTAYLENYKIYRK